MPLVFAALVAIIAVTGAQAQDPDYSLPAPGMERPMITREQLQSRLAELQQELASPGYSSSLRDTRKAEVDAIKARLADGDIRVGDVITLQVTGDPGFNHSYTVTPAGTIVLPAGTEIPLKGLLRSEVQGYLSQKLSAFILHPVVQVALSVRLSLDGNVNKPCFSCSVEPGQPLNEFLQVVGGGPGHNVDLGRSYVKRGDRTVIDGKEFEEAMRNGRTIDELNLQGGDEVFVGTKPSTAMWTRIFGALTGALGMVYLITRIH